MYAQTAKKPNPLLRNGAYGIVMKGVHFCTRGCASLRGRNSAPLCCIKLDTATDPCCGSGGFFLAAQEFLSDPNNYTLERKQNEFLKNETFYGNEIVPDTFKTALMNLYLHNIGDIYGNVPVTLGDALLTDPGYRVDYVMTNPPFGKKSSITFTNKDTEQEEEDLVYNRQDFWTKSSNKQLNFVQHINTILKSTGKAAVVVPDNVLFEGGAGETVRKKLLQTTDLHTILRLPTGIFYKPGVKANVIFFDKRPASAKTHPVRIQLSGDVIRVTIFQIGIKL